MFNVKDKHVLITGAASGIGLGLAEHFATQGATVSTVDISEKNPNPSLGLNHFKADVSNSEELHSAFESAVKRNGVLDVVINNAGIAIEEGAIENADISILEKVLNINVKGVYLGIQNAAKYLTDGGSIINTGSLAASVTFPEYCTYSISKSSVIQMTKNAALQLGNRKIRVNSVSPGTVLTPMEAESGDEARISKTCTALERPADISDLIGIYHFLASDASRYITGIDVKVDGGWSAGVTNKALACLLD
ncbi:SDR family oxidoreductase [Thalassotalea fonticola]|uniref:SDR family oxidoreductase n=1 Tax=Thalassotalea fonticola TaxID=3065649 RepID=A0ABZ0GMP6_9GAMM|nr:SDR family oxidoreductase [Colwelliaceae bacterium S1-1]